MKVRAALDALSTQTSTFLAICHANGINVSEDVITTNNLVFLKHQVPKAAVVWDTRLWESAIGCDFEMWLGSTTHGWRGYAVQAKRLDIPSGKYLGLSHKNALGAQIDLLEAYADWAGVEPLYLFYNTHVPHVHDLCGSPYLTAQQGCTISPSTTVRKALVSKGARNFRWIHSMSSTALWRCLTCATGAGAHTCWPNESAGKTHSELPGHVQCAIDRGEPPPDSYAAYEKRFRAKAIVVIDTSTDEG